MVIFFIGDTVHSYSDEFTQRKDTDIVSMNISISYTEKPENDFSTGYFELKKYIEE